MTTVSFIVDRFSSFEKRPTKNQQRFLTFDFSDTTTPLQHDIRPHLKLQADAATTTSFIVPCVE
jgi:hypothetical protein